MLPPYVLSPVSACSVHDYEHCNELTTNKTVLLTGALNFFHPPFHEIIYVYNLQTVDLSLPHVFPGREQLKDSKMTRIQPPATDSQLRQSRYWSS
jgi:hypothetical protein